MSNITLLKMTIYGAAVTVLASSLAACGNSKWHEVDPNTGDVMIQNDKPADPPLLREGQEVRVQTPRVRIRNDRDQRPQDSTVSLERGDTIRITDPTPRNGTVEAVIVHTNAPNAPTTPIYVPPEYVAPEVPPANPADRYFMIQNIATEKARIYEACTPNASGVCHNKLILETDLVAGENTRARRSDVGNYRISAWFKFYEDNEHHYPSWYSGDATFPALPAPGAPVEAWLSPSLLPPGPGKIRGAFGWYTAKVEPRANDQWTHGTLGWGADGGRFIEAMKHTVNADVDPRSAGCTRLENQAIALMREIMPEGSKIIRVYAKEALRDSARTRYQNNRATRWSWILTKEGVDVDGPTSSARSVEARGVEANQILERGTYTTDQMPDAVAFVASGDGATARNGNLYDLPESEIKGVFYVDEGRLEGYEHPSSLRVGGNEDGQLPSIAISTAPRASSAGSEVEGTATQTVDGGTVTAPPAPPESVPPVGGPASAANVAASSNQAPAAAPASGDAQSAPAASVPAPGAPAAGAPAQAPAGDGAVSPTGAVAPPSTLMTPPTN